MPWLTCALKSAKRPVLSRFIPILGAALIGLGALGCSHSADHPAGLDVDSGAATKPPPTGNDCSSPAEGCACDTAGATADCGQVERVSGDYISCSMGVLTCTDGKWGACIGDRIANIRAPSGTQHPQNLGTSTTCPDNPCDPYCEIIVDDPTGLPLPDGGALSSDGGLQVLPHQESSADGLCTAMTVSPTPQTLTVTGFGSSGLLADYFAQIDTSVSQIPSTWTPVFSHQEPNINLSFTGGTGPAITGIGPENYSIRWTGKIVAATTEAYTLCLGTDDGGRLWVDGNLLVNRWNDQSFFEVCSTPLSWVAGQAHDIRVEYFQAQFDATALLSWSTPTIAKTVVPASAFQSPSNAQVSPITTGTAKFGVALTPANCFPGTPTPAWTLDRLDLATIDNTGAVNLISAVAGPITATAYLGPFSASGVVNVVVNVTATDQAPTGSVTNFQNAVGAADTAQILYPYDQTVLPIGLRAPVIQWDNKGTAASAVKVSLKYPTTGTAIFNWSEIIPESTPPQATIPLQVWKLFEETAKGQSAQFSVQRVIGTQPRQPIARTLTFSTTPVRGKIYYTQYQRNGGPGLADILAADPGSENPAASAFGTSDGCPVCHTLSANGTVFAAADRSFSATLGGISSVNANGTLSPIADFVGLPSRPTYQVGADDWRGFAWAPLTPDGKYALAADNVWGNTSQQLVGIDASRHAIVSTTMMSGGNGVGLLAKYYPSTNYSGTPWKRIDPQINFDFGSNSPSPAVTNDFSVKRTGQVQAYFSETYKFEVVSTGDTSSLTVNGATSTTGTLNVALTAGALVPIELDEINPSGNSNIQLYWSSPSTPRALVPQTQLYLPATEQHGAKVTYYANNNFTGATYTRIEPDIASDYGAHAPAPGIGVDNWTDKWDANLESPTSAAIKLCVNSDDAVAVTVDGTLVNAITSTVTGTFSACSNSFTTWTAGSSHTLHLEHHEDGGNAKLILSWQYTGANGGVNENIPSAYLTPAGYTAPTNGLTATYYDIETFDAVLPQNQTNPRAFTRVDPNIDLDFGSGRPNYSTISDDDYFSGRWTGQIILPCSGVYEFQSNGNIDDGGRMWIDNERVMGVWKYAALSGGAYLTAGTHDFKFDWYELTGNATARLMWRTPCDTNGWVTIPTTAFTPTVSANEIGGFIADGGDNGNNTSYWVWQTPTAAAPTPIDVTTQTRGTWGLGSTAMMVPTFSPDASKLVFIDGDSSGGAGWRKGLSTWDFNESTKLFQNRRLLVNDWPSRDVLKWPTFESDSQSVIFQSTTPGDTCCRGNLDSNGNTRWTKYGYMGPTNYYEDPGRLWSIDSKSATPTPVALAKLNSGEQATDANKSYQPSVLPTSAGGYRWVVFTSTRPYGNSVNLASVQKDFSNTSTYAAATYTPMTNSGDIQSQLWVAAIDDTTSAGADRSHPAFWLPSQNFVASSNSTYGYVNERAFWVLDACHNAGTSAASTCEVDEDCCGGAATPKTAACRLDTPVSNPPTRHCQALPPAGQCVAANGSCGSTADCCSGLACVNAVCQVPPPVLVVGDANYERIYQADCPDGTKPVWHFFDYKTTTPATSSSLEIYAETAADPSTFHTLSVAPNAVVVDGVAHLTTVTGAPVTDWTGVDVATAFSMLDPIVKSQEYLKITVRFVPNQEHTASPILNDWRQVYSCPPAE